MQGGPRSGVKRGKKRRGGKKKRKQRGGQHRVGPPRRRPKSYCVCPACGTKVALYTEVPCYIMHCSKCGSQMVKEGTGARPPVDIQPQ
jgi:Zn ribbon nucleic-acid-binding protein